MTKFYVTHTDSHGERHQIGAAFEAKTPQDALYTILEQSGADDDGCFEVFRTDAEEMSALMADNLRRIDRLPRRALMRFLDIEKSRANTRTMRVKARLHAIKTDSIEALDLLDRAMRDVG